MHLKHLKKFNQNSEAASCYNDTIVDRGAFMENDHTLDNAVLAPAIPISSCDTDVESIRLEIAAADDPNLRQILEEYLSSWLQHTRAPA
jgi:hypothetical protein